MPAIYSRAHSASKSRIRTMAVRVIATSGAGSVPPRHILWVCYWQVLHLFIHSTSMSCLDQPVYSQAATVSTLMLYGGCFRTVAWRDGDTASYSLMGREGANSCLQASDKLKNLVLFFFQLRLQVEDTVWKGENALLLPKYFDGSWWSGYLKLEVNSFLDEVKYRGQKVLETQKQKGMLVLIFSWAW